MLFISRNILGKKIHGYPFEFILQRSFQESEVMIHPVGRITG